MLERVPYYIYVCSLIDMYPGIAVRLSDARGPPPGVRGEGAHMGLGSGTQWVFFPFLQRDLYC